MRVQLAALKCRAMQLDNDSVPRSLALSPSQAVHRRTNVQASPLKSKARAGSLLKLLDIALWVCALQLTAATAARNKTVAYLQASQLASCVTSGLVWWTKHISRAEYCQASAGRLPCAWTMPACPAPCSFCTVASRRKPTLHNAARVPTTSRFDAL